jgi:diaminopimelate epimerase
VRLTKLHGLGNDFLVAFPAPGAEPGPDDARRWCDRRRGIGADGLLLGLAPAPGDGDVDLRMVLLNADGSRAEMSGNGIRCLAQAELRRRGGAPGRLRIRTDAGDRVVDVRPTEDPVTVLASVSMGAARAVPAPAGVPGARVLGVDIGNPHLVVLAEPGSDLLALGRAHPDLNVELVRAAGPDRLEMTVHERGVGVTEACGTGACAAAFAAHKWGLVGRTSTVRMPGGEVQVRLDPGGVTLSGPSTHIASIEVP